MAPIAPSDDIGAFREKVLALISKQQPGATMKDVSLAIGMNHAYMQQFIYRRVPKHLNETIRIKLARYLRVDEKELLEPDQIASIAAVAAIEEEFIKVPLYDVRASAGHGFENERPDILHYIAFRREWLKRICAAPADQMAVISVVGDSMEPNLSANDTVLVDLTQTRPGDDGIYVLLYEDGLRVKRLRIDPVRRIVRITSDNPAYDPIDNVRPDEIKVFGRVIWLGRRV